MKPPGWMVMDPPRLWEKAPDGESVIVNIRIRRWHPGFWWFVFETLVLRKADR